MSEKRKLATRATAAASKKRKSSPPEISQKVATPKSATPVVEEPLPKSHTAGKPLPTLPDPQPEDLSSKEFQSVAESGVLADSLLRSKQKWISEGIFERYWTKPVKKKKEEPTEPPNNPAKESMTKLGNCIITVEPHVFEATMYAVKNPVAPQSQTPLQAARPVLQYGPPGGVVQQHQQRPASLQTQFTPVRTSTQDSNGTPATGTPVNGTPSFSPAATAAQTPTPISTNPGPAPAKSTDPVIQMLAERAATDQNLKALMRIVAGGNASPDELKQFQSHIDDLTRQLQARPRPNSQPGPRATSTNGVQTTPSQPQALRSKGPVPSKADISAVVFEFAGGSGDRFMFPKYSILEFLPGNQVIASFLIVRKGTPEDSPYYDPQLDYYQPVTIRIFSQQGRQLETLGKVVAPQEEVRKYMDDIMDNMTRAEYVLLAMRLPKEKEKEPEPEIAPQNMAMTQVLWVPTPNAIVPISKTKMYQGPVTEEQAYREFIQSVS